jgi:hypothetical protein
MKPADEFKRIWLERPVRATLHLIWRLPLMVCWFVEGLIEGFRRGRR